jgi:WS/DGAT/MGAT family acyltransferase
MQQLSGLDAAFLYLESPRTPMHVGAVYLFDALARLRRFSFAAFRDHLAAHLDAVPTLRQRLVEVPLSLDHPYWITDPAFDLDAHLSQQTLPRPGGWQELLNRAEQFFSEPLDRARPLWAMQLVEGVNRVSGLRKGSFALLVKAHHAAVDGVGGEEVIWSLLDPLPMPLPYTPPSPLQPERPPSLFALLSRAAGRTLRQPLTLARAAGQLAVGAVRVVQERSRHGTPLPPLPLTAPSTGFNGTVSGERILRALVLPLPRVKAIKRRLDDTATVNDVALAICAGALRRQLEANQDLPAQPLLAMVPISLRTPSQRQDIGNRVSAMLVSLATDQSDPLERFQQIHASAQHAKRYFQAFDLQPLLELIPATATGLLGRLYCQLEVPQRLGPFFNLFITNVPGPRRPLYLGGARLAYQLGTAPIYDGLGIILVITSCLDTLTISVTSCRKNLPDPDRFIRYLQQSFAELEAVVVTREGPGASEGEGVAPA